MRPAPPDAARILDVGCGSGGNLLPMALLWPNSEYVGIDLASGAVAKAQAKAQELGLSNVRFEAADLMELPADFGQFDYIIAHGFISWVPTAVRARLFEVSPRTFDSARRRLHQLQRLPGIARARHVPPDHARTYARIADPVKRAEEARSIVQTIAESGVCSDAIQELARSERDIICRKSIGALSHDELEANFNSLYFHEFASLAKAHDLQFIFEAVYNEGSLRRN